jgi:hypothetical protein
MAVVEYKLHVINNQGHMVTPPWIQDGSHWYSAADKTMIGWIPAEADREYWVPDNIVTLTKAELNTRMLAIHAVKKYQKQTSVERDSNGEPVNPEAYLEFEDQTDAEVTTMSNDWYDAYILGK